MSAPKDNVDKAINMLDNISSVAETLSASITIAQQPLSESDYNKLEEFSGWIMSADKRYKDKYVYNRRQ